MPSPSPSSSQSWGLRDRQSNIQRLSQVVRFATLTYNSDTEPPTPQQQQSAGECTLPCPPHVEVLLQSLSSSAGFSVVSCEHQSSRARGCQAKHFQYPPRLFRLRHALRPAWAASTVVRVVHMPVIPDYACWPSGSHVPRTRWGSRERVAPHHLQKRSRRPQKYNLVVHLNLSIFCSRVIARRSPDVERSASLSMACHA